MNYTNTTGYHAYWTTGWSITHVMPVETGQTNQFSMRVDRRRKQWFLIMPDENFVIVHTYMGEKLKRVFVCNKDSPLGDLFSYPLNIIKFVVNHLEWRWKWQTQQLT